MKIHIDLPWGGVLHIEKQKMDDCTKLAIGACILMAVPFIAFVLAVR